MTWTLTEKEMFIAKLVSDRLQNAEIAVLTGNTEYVIKNKIRTIFDKLRAVEPNPSWQCGT